MPKYDLHTHLFHTWEKGKFSLERAPRNVDYIISAINNAGLDGIVLANSHDARYEKFAWLSREHDGEYRMVRELENALVFVDKKETKEIKIIKGDEVETKEGHVLVIGAKYFQNMWGESLERTLKIAEKHGAVKIATHVFGCYGIGKENLLKYVDEFHAFEGFNGNYSNFFFKGNLNQKEIERLEKELGIPGISVSDSHNKKDIGNGHIEILEDLEFTNSDNLKDSLKDVLKNKRFKLVIRKLNSLSSVVGHVAVCLYDCKIRRPLGLIKQKN